MIGIILGGRLNALSVARSLSEFECERHVISTCSSHICKVSKFVDRYSFFESSSEVLSALGQYSQEIIKVVYATNDFWASFLAENEEYLRSRGFYFLIAPKESIDVILDKFFLYQKFGEKVLMPETVLASRKAEFSKNKDYILKPRRSFLDELVVKKGFRDCSESSQDFVVQERLSMNILNHYSFSGVALQGQVIFGGLTHKVLEYPSPGGTATLVVPSNNAGCLYDTALAEAEKIISEVVYSGVFEIEFIFYKERLWFLEFNPRFWLQHEIFNALGVNIAVLYTNLCLGRSCQDVEFKYKKAVWLHEGFLFSIFLTKFDFIKVVRCLFSGGRVLAYWRMSDPKPFFRFVRELICKKQ
ncbi:hypothetical protein [Gilvimarinus polysaccharolyticus]|uniref:hypothetical protein n=1 Tax=Gilvimarinus polysaccharolyticus TaxID=863921 RepID=UPI0006736E65|nr:hypothetical protein [Gilvimarinus polysaccharolyticus]